MFNRIEAVIWLGMGIAVGFDFLPIDTEFLGLVACIGLSKLAMIQGDLR